ncbi:MAG: ArsC/Spx/MgsR family protein [Pseudomonadota bacterium]
MSRAVKYLRALRQESQLGKVGWESLLNRKSLTWRQVPESDRQNLSRDRAMALMLEEPTLIKRPVLESPGFTAVGFSEPRFEAFLSGKGESAS